MALGSKLREARLKMNLTASQVAAATRMKVQIVEALEREDFSHIAAPIYGKGFIKLYAESVGLNPKSLIDEYVRLLGSPPAPTLVTDEGHPPKPAPLRPELAALETDKYTPAAGEAVTVNVEESEAARAPEPGPGASASAIGELPPQPTANAAADLELFAHAEARAAKTPRKEVPVEVPDEFRYHASRKKEKEEPTDLWAKRAAAVQADAAPAEKDGGKDSGPPARFNFGEFPLRTVAIIVGILVVVVCLVSGLSRCTRQPARAVVAPRPATPSEPLRPALPLPDPYVN